MCKNFIFFISFILVLSLVPTSVTKGADPDLVGWWMFDDGAGTTALDSSGSGNDGTLNNGPVWVAGQIDGALQFDGVDDYVSAPHIAFNSRTFTIAMWVNPVWYTEQTVIFAQHQEGATNLSMHFRLNWTSGTGEAYARMGFYSNDLDTPSMPVVDNTWYHLTFWYDFENTTRRIYLNGVQAAQDNGAPYLGTTGETRIGIWNTDQWFRGIIDDVRVYHRALTVTEIEQIMLGEDIREARNPDPAHLAVDVPIDANLGWTRGAGTLQEEVYFGTDPCALPKVADILVLPINPPLYEPPVDLIASTTYYWEIVEVNSMDRFPSGIWEFTTISGEAQDDYPYDGAIISGDTVTYLGDDYIWTKLTFIPGPTAASHTGYFHEDYSKVESRHPDANLGGPPYISIPGWEYTFFAGNPQVAPAKDTLVRGTRYYWTVDASDALSNTFAGDIWSFAIQGFHAFAPSPPDESIFIGTTPYLSWLPGFGVADHDIYMGTSWEDVNNARYDFYVPPPEFVITRSDPNYQVKDINTLPYSTKIYWRVDQVNGRMPPPMGGGEYFYGDVWEFTTVPEGVGTINENLWLNFTNTGTSLADLYSTLYAHPNFPGSPDATNVLTSFDTGPNKGDNYGGLVHGWLHPAYSGDYTFWYACDDPGELFLSTDNQPGNMVRIAYIDGWAGGPYDWYNQGGTNNPNQQSVSIPLVAGQKYYIRATYKEVGGDDYCNVAWQGPDQPLAPVQSSASAVIPGSRLSPYVQLWAHDPSPRDWEFPVPVSSNLKWGPGDHAFQHDVYFGTDKNAVKNATTSSTGIYQGRIGPNTLSVLLDAATFYYWRVDEVNLAGPDPCLWKGSTWTFRTEGAAGGLLGLYYHWDGILPPQGSLPYEPGPANAFQVFVLSRIDPSVNWNWGEGSPDPNVNIDDFGCKWVGHVECPVDANYTFYTTTDDGARLFINGQPVLDVGAWRQQGMTEWSGEIVLTPGLHDIEMHMYERAGGAGAELRWSSVPTSPSDDAIPKQIIPPMWLWPPLFASGPRPPDGATIDDRTPALEWIAGVNADYHELYFSANFDDVNNRTPGIKQILSDPCRPYPAVPRLELGETYYWLVDEVKSSPPGRWNARTVWSFTISECLSLDNMEDYNDRGELRRVWRDGNANVVWTGTYPYLTLYQGGSSGSNLNVSTAVGSPTGAGPIPPTPLNYEAMVLYYDNDGQTYKALPGEEKWIYDAPYYSEIEANTVGDNSLDVGQTWDSEGVKSLSVSFQGHPVSDGYYEAPDWPVYTVYGRGRDIQGRHDEFYFLSQYPFIGAGSIQAQVLSVENTDPWAKAGVMIREKRTPYSKYAAVFITPGNGVTFQYRDVEDGPTTTITKPGVSAPQFVRLVRNISGAFEAKHSDNPFVWQDVNAPDTAPVLPEIAMGTIDDPNIYVGSAVTSHNANQICAADLNDLLISPLPPNWIYGNIGTNDPEQLYVALSDGTNTDVVEHNDVNAATLTTWQEWNIALTDFTTVNLDGITKVYIGFGDRAAPVQGGSGAIYVDDIRACPPRCIPALAKPLYDIAQPYDCIVDEKDLGVWAADYLESGIAVEDVWTTGAWTNTDIGDVCSPGSFTDLGSDSFEISASGFDIWGVTDEFHYAYKPLSGDGQITVRVVSILPDPSLNEWTKAGVMIRDTLDPNSAHATMAVTPNYQPNGTGPQGHRVSAQGRIVAGDASFNVQAGNMTGPMCIRLIRQGNTFTTYYYYDDEWIELASTDIVMTDPVYIGMVVTAHEDSGPLATAKFDRLCSNTFLTTDIYSDFLINLKDYALIADKYLEEMLWPAP